MRGLRGATVAMVLMALVQPAHAQGEVATIGAVSVALSQALNGFKSTLETMGGEMKGVGNSLQANAQNVLADLDKAIAGNINLTFDKLDTQQQALYRDAQALTKQLAKATMEVTNNAGSQARLTIADADILAYNTTYSLPCRTQTPRIVMVTPDAIRVGRDTPEVTVKGNFLDQAPDGAVTIGGQPAQILARSANEMRLAIPPSVAAAVKTRGSVAISIAAQERRKKMILLFCNTSTVPVTLQAWTLLLPKRTFSLTGWMQPTSLKTETRKEKHEFNSGKPGDCDANVDVSQNVCAPMGWTVAAITNFSVTGKNCGSNAGPASISGARCVNVPGRVRGCGYRGIEPFRDCKGRGWVNWKMKTTLTHDVRAPMPRQSFTISSSDQASWSFPYATNVQLREPEWTYGAHVDVIEGDQKYGYEISHAQQVVGPVKGRLVDGILGITVDDGDL
ncbi:IPT/TIG domain-containing protein [Sphingobium sp. AP49]|uniref:IPT/TIG domain-containing protein n=1 Tax=Sphingobium sp. AP49 TaxID=1144307 RepID=UPI00026EDF69|nr:IPT/TIG domain-containing protein [Sphingobium sp. AP49]WHO38520.1 IPT/TIG domain-containing protein [Sphingobium sp. AP49]